MLYTSFSRHHPFRIRTRRGAMVCWCAFLCFHTHSASRVCVISKAFVFICVGESPAKGLALKSYSPCCSPWMESVYEWIFRAGEKISQLPQVSFFHSWKRAVVVFGACVDMFRHQHSDARRKSMNEIVWRKLQSSLSNFAIWGMINATVLESTAGKRQLLRKVTTLAGKVLAFLINHPRHSFQGCIRCFSR